MKKIKVILLIIVTTIVLTAIICWFINRRTLGAFCDALMYAGIAYLVAGGASLMGGIKLSTNSSYQYARTVGTQRTSDRIKDDHNSMDKSFVFLLSCAFVSFILIGLSCLIKYII